MKVLDAHDIVEFLRCRPQQQASRAFTVCSLINWCACLVPAPCLPLAPLHLSLLPPSPSPLLPAALCLTLSMPCTWPFSSSRWLSTTTSRVTMCTCTARHRQEGDTARHRQRWHQHAWCHFEAMVFIGKAAQVVAGNMQQHKKLGGPCIDIRGARTPCVSEVCC